MATHQYEHVHGYCPTCKSRSVGLPDWSDPTVAIGNLFSLGLEFNARVECDECGAVMDDTTIHQPHPPVPMVY